MPPKKHNNKIDAKEAELIGDVLHTIGEEIHNANASLMRKSLERADHSDLTHHVIDSASAEYTMEMEVGTEADGVGKKRKSNVTVQANYVRQTPTIQGTPFNILFGVIAPAERKREAILDLLRSKLPADKNISDADPLFSIKENVFWAVVEDGNEYYVVELETGQVRFISSLEELMSELNPMHRFLKEQLAKTVIGE